jgi:hypothetical protein
MARMIHYPENMVGISLKVIRYPSRGQAPEISALRVKNLPLFQMIFSLPQKHIDCRANRVGRTSDTTITHVVVDGPKNLLVSI